MMTNALFEVRAHKVQGVSEPHIWVRDVNRNGDLEIELFDHEEQNATCSYSIVLTPEQRLQLKEVL